MRQLLVGVLQEGDEHEEEVRDTLLALGWTEAISSTFAGEADTALFAPPGDEAVPMGNPLSAEAGVLRPSLLPGMASMVQLNGTRDVPALRHNFI